MEYVIAFLLAYIIGTISPARIMARKIGNIDITKVNSKNPGTSNIALTFGMKHAVIVGLLDISKGLLPVVVARQYNTTDDILWMITGIGAILGHVYPVFMKFKGGKGTATFGGVVIGMAPMVSLFMIFAFIFVLFTTKYIAIATGFLMVSYPVIFYLYGYQWVTIGILSAFSLLSLYKHIPNFLAIIRHEELGIDAVNKH
jgi:glycerol-3-phosphate acyltransferase PlsY